MTDASDFNFLDAYAYEIGMAVGAEFKAQGEHFDAEALGNAALAPVTRALAAHSPESRASADG